MRVRHFHSEYNLKKCVAYANLKEGLLHPMGNQATSASRLGVASSTAIHSEKSISRLIEKGDWGIVTDLINENTDYVDKKAQGTLRLPLHTAIIKGAPEDVIDLLISIYPKAVTTKDADGMTPFLYAIQHQVSMNILQKLLLLDPDAAKEYDVTGKLAIHFGCCNRSNAAVIKLLKESYPDCVSRRTRSGQLPIHYACEYRCVQWIYIFLIIHFLTVLRNIHYDAGARWKCWKS